MNCTLDKSQWRSTSVIIVVCKVVNVICRQSKSLHGDNFIAFSLATIVACAPTSKGHIRQNLYIVTYDTQVCFINKWISINKCTKLHLPHNRADLLLPPPPKKNTTFPPTHPPRLICWFVLYKYFYIYCNFLDKLIVTYRKQLL